MSGFQPGDGEFESLTPCLRDRGPVRSGRQIVNLEIVGSSPIGPASIFIRAGWLNVTTVSSGRVARVTAARPAAREFHCEVAKLAKRLSVKQVICGFESHLRSFM